MDQQQASNAELTKMLHSQLGLNSSTENLLRASPGPGPGSPSLAPVSMPNPNYPQPPFMGGPTPYPMQMQPQMAQGPPPQQQSMGPLQFLMGGMGPMRQGPVTGGPPMGMPSNVMPGPSMPMPQMQPMQHGMGHPMGMMPQGPVHMGNPGTPPPFGSANPQVQRQGSFPSMFAPQPSSPHPFVSGPVTVTNIQNSAINPALRASADNLVKKEQKKLEPPGMRITEEVFTFAGTADTTKVKEMEVTPITLYSSEYSYQPGNLIAVNKNFICYAIRANMIRALHKKSASKGLLKGHNAPLSDIQFSPASDSNILVSAGMDGTIYVWKLAEAPDSVLSEVVMHIPNSGFKLCRIAWFDGVTFVSAEVDAKTSRSLLYIWNVEQVDKTTREANCLALGSDEIQDISVSVDRRIAVAAGSSVKIWDSASRKQLIEFEPHKGEPVTRVLLRSSFLLTGANMNTEIKLWSTRTWKCLQTIRLPSTLSANEGQPAFHFALDLTGSFIFVASAKQKPVYALHIQTGEGKKAKINNITEFTVSYPILSFTVTNHERIGSKYQPQTQDCIDMQLYCIQTKAIQLYHVNSEQCFLPNPDLDVLEDEEPEQEEDSVVEVEPEEREQEQEDEEKEPEVEYQASVPVISLVEDEQKPVVKTEVTIPEASNEAVSDNTEIIEQLAEEVITEVVKAEDTEIANQEFSQPANHTDVQLTEASHNLELLTPSSFTLSQPTDQDTDATEAISEEAAKSTDSILQLIDDAKPKRENETTKKGTKSKSRSRNKKPETPAKEETKPKQVSIMTRPKQETVSPVLSPQPVPLVEEVVSVPSEPVSEPKPKIKKEKREEKKEETKKEDVSRNSVQVLESTSIPSEAVGGESLLLAELRRMENNINSRIEKTLHQQVDRLYSRLEKERQEREKLERERQERLLTAISQTLNTNMSQQMEEIIHKELQDIIVPALGKVLVQTLENSLLKPLQEHIKKIITQNFTPKIEASLKESISKTVLSKQMGGEVAKNLTAALRQPLQESFVATFQESLIPAFEKSCQSMFRQLNSSFERGLQDRVIQIPGEYDARKTEAVTQQLKSAVDSLIEISNTMSKTIVETQNKVISDYIERANGYPFSIIAFDNNQTPSHLNTSGGHPPEGRPMDATQSTKVQLQKLLSSQRYEEAFSLALSARNIDLIAWLCSKLNIDQFFGTTPLPLSQHVMLSLVQQLGFDLSKDTMLKLNWLRECALVLNLKDKLISEHGPMILTKVLHNLEEHYQKHSDTQTLTAFKLLMHVINSLLK